MRQGYRHAGQVPFDQSAQSAFVQRISDRPEQANGDGFDARLLELFESFDDRRLIQGSNDRPVGVDAFGHLEGEGARHVRLGIGDPVVEEGQAHAAGLPQNQDVRVAFGREEGGLRGLARQHGVGRHGGAMNHKINGRQQLGKRQVLVFGGGLQTRDHARDQVVGHRRRLVKLETAVFLEDEVGKGPADIDSESHGAAGPAAFPARRRALCSASTLPPPSQTTP